MDMEYLPIIVAIIILVITFWLYNNGKSRTEIHEYPVIENPNQKGLCFLEGTNPGDPKPQPQTKMIMTKEKCLDNCLSVRKSGDAFVGILSGGRRTFLGEDTEVYKTYIHKMKTGEMGDIPYRV